jgi:hypothetical protein
MKTLLTAAALILSMTAAASAADTPRAGDTLAAGPIYTINGYSSDCWYINLGTANIIPTSQVMYAWYSNVPVSTSTTCPNGSAVGPGTSCAIYPNVANINGFSCQVVFSTPVANVRGSLELLDTNNNELSQVELR